MKDGNHLLEMALRIQDQANRFLTVLFWLLGDSMRLRRREWVRLMIATLFTLGSNLMVLGVVYFYVRLLESNYSLHLFGTQLVARESVVMLALFAASLLVAMLIYSASDYVLRVESLNLYRRYHEEAVKRAWCILERLPDRRALGATKMIEAHGLRRLVNEYSRLCGWALRFLSAAVPAVLVFFGSLFGLILLDPVTTVLVAAMGMLVIAAQYPSNIFAATASNVAEKTRKSFKDGIHALANRAAAQTQPIPNQDLHDQIEGFFEKKPVKRYAQADVDRFRAMELSSLWMRTGGGIMLAIVLFMIGSDLLGKDADWATLIAYATLLRLMLANTTAVFRAVTMYSRFLPYIQHARAFAVAGAPAFEPWVPAAEPPEKLSLGAELVVFPAPDADENTRECDPLKLDRGTATAVLSKHPLGKDLAIALQNALSMPAAQIPDIEVRTLADAEVCDARVGSEQGAETMSGGGGASSLVLIAQQELANWPRERAERYLQGLRRHFVLIVYPASVGRIPQFGEHCLLVRNYEERFYHMVIPEAGLDKRALQEARRLIGVAQKGTSSAPDDDDDVE